MSRGPRVAQSSPLTLRLFDFRRSGDVATVSADACFDVGHHNSTEASHPDVASKSYQRISSHKHLAVLAVRVA